MAKPQTIRSNRAVGELRAQLEGAELEKAELRSRAEQAEQRARSQPGPGWRLAALGTVLLALLGVSGTLTGSYIGAHSASQGASLQQREELDLEARQKRGQVYADYISATVTYRAEVKRVLDESSPARISADLQRLALLYQDFNNKADLVAVYGSDDAWDAQLTISSVLPRIVDGYRPGKLRMFWLEHDSYTDEKYFGGYNEFENVFCREASARPRSGCE
jgi:hypothetical protein